MNDDLADPAPRKDINITGVAVEWPGQNCGRARVANPIDTDAEKAVGRKIMFTGSDVNSFGIRW